MEPPVADAGRLESDGSALPTRSDDGQEEVRARALDPRSTDESTMTPGSMRDGERRDKRPVQMKITRHMRRHRPDLASRRTAEPS